MYGFYGYVPPQLKAERALRYALQLNTGEVEWAAGWLKRPDGAKLRSRVNDALLKRTSLLPDFSDSDSSDTEC